ncbi:glutaredoxin family protein [Catellicoccus marimammalium]|uniref:Ribonucleoside-diphosphate reductase 2, NrdH-redoxin n=1 Tax=Catellicoccus marimammalium M35/04/3 TaxID=1234409 RepID=K8ZNV6_9ENTE|nr:glutaredoxin family protein [Catellicoccus marimammalium]EKU27276.1 ribonucleoside-diphosphate reductase 2, NrdH-redoxin [Catellicoccus marimammalium M35/04/3]
MKLYTKNQCPQCMLMKRFLTEHQLDFEEINIEEDESAKDYLLENQIRQVPAVFIDGEWILGFQPQKVLEKSEG